MKLGGAPVYPTRLEESYQRDLLRVVRVSHALLMPRIERILDKLRPSLDERARADSAAEDLAQILRVIERVRRLPALQSEHPTEADLLAIAAKADRHVAAEVARTIALDVTQGGRLTALYEAWAAENAALITSIPGQYLDQVADIARQAVSEGTLTRDIARQIEGRYGVTQSRAKLIARDQIGKLNGQLTQQRQTSLGIEEYIWSTSKDERVRDMHRDLEGSTQRWDTPPITNEKGDRNHPGGDYQCRCVARPVIPS